MRLCHCHLCTVAGGVMCAPPGSRPGRRDKEPDRRIRGAGQGDRPHLPSRDPHQPDGRVRRAQGDAEGLRYLTPDRDAAYRLFRRGRRDQADGRGRADLYRLDVRREPGASRRRASGLRRLAHELQDALCAGVVGEQPERAGARHRASARRSASSRGRSRCRAATCRDAARAGR